MSEFRIIAIVASALVGLLICLLLRTIRASLASCEPEAESHLKAR
jgi:hypothetical protein